MDELVAYIEKEQEKGFGETLIKEKLREAGYSEKEINQGFGEAYRKELYKRSLSKVIEEKHTHRWWKVVLALFGIIILTAVVVMAVLQSGLLDQEVVLPENPEDCSGLVYPENDICLLHVSAAKNSTLYCQDMEGQVNQYQCRQRVWDTNYCNYLILTGQPTEMC